MDCVRGQIMRSLKGHDKGDFQVVLKTDGAYAYMADGKRRKVEAPKKKKLMHLAKTNTVLTLSEYPTDNRLKQALAAFGQPGAMHEGGQELV